MKPDDRELNMKSELNRLIDYAVTCINDFGDAHNLPYAEAFRYLSQYGALDFLEEFYEVEHTLPQQDVLEDMSAICRQNGGVLA